MAEQTDTPITKMVPEQTDNGVHEGEEVVTPDELEELKLAVMFDED